jgi:hypothetical protein
LAQYLLKKWKERDGQGEGGREKEGGKERESV